MLGRVFFLFCAVILCFGVISVSGSEAASFTFTKLADTDTAIPGGAGNFAFFQAPAFDGSAVAFFGGGACFCVSQLGVYEAAGGSLSKLADSNTAIPGGIGRFQFFGEVAMGGGTVAFRGDGGSTQGIYASSGGSLVRVADTNTLIPNGVGTFASFGSPLTVDAGRVVFVGTGSSLQRGVYSFVSGTSTAVVDTSVAVPGGVGNFRGFFAPSAHAANIAFAGFDANFTQGIYAIVGTSLAKVVNANTPIPGGTGNFAFFGNPSFDGDTVAFLGFNASGTSGVYVGDAAGTLNVVADIATQVPGGSEHFVFFGDPAIDNGSVVFVGVDSAGRGALYRAAGEPLTRIVGTGDVLDGKEVAGVAISRQASQSDAIAFLATFMDGSAGIFVAIPPLSVDIDIKPGGHPNTVNLGANGSVPVAILSSATFDATTVNPTTVTLASAPVRLKGTGLPLASIEDVNGDGLADLIVHVNTSALQLSTTDVEAVLEGQTFGGMSITGSDSVRVLP